MVPDTVPQPSVFDNLCSLCVHKVLYMKFEYYSRYITAVVGRHSEQRTQSVALCVF